jgi:membrane-anchored mycosin MYCP
VTSTGGPANDDCVGHGTFVAGIIAARPVDGIGFAGVAPDATILPVRQTTSGVAGTADGMATAIRWAVDQRARVVNVSAAATFTSPALQEAVDYATRHDVLIVAAASNDAERGNPKTYPAAYPQVVGVGAVAPDGSRSAFSEVGGFVSVAAPGSDVLSVGPRGRGHLVGNGTSFAAPFVAGVAALVRAYHPRLTAAQVKHRLEATADHPASALPDRQVGWGVVNPYAAVTAVLPEESGTVAATAGAATVPGPRWPDRADPHRRVAWLIAITALALAAGAAAIRGIVAKGRRRRETP